MKFMLEDFKISGKYPNNKFSTHSLSPNGVNKQLLNNTLKSKTHSPFQ